MSRTRDEILESRRRLKAEYGTLFDSVSALLYRHDPVGINFEENTDEYEIEAETILQRLSRCHTLEDVHNGSREHYKQIAPEIRRLWQEYLARNPTS